MEWSDPDTGETYEIIYDVPQASTTEREGFIWRRSDEWPAKWQKLPPFVSHRDMRKLEDEVFGPTQGWQHGIPASIVSDIERLDTATDKLVESIDDGQSYAAVMKDDVEVIMDAIADARDGLLYLTEKLKNGHKS